MLKIRKYKMKNNNIFIDYCYNTNEIKQLQPILGLEQSINIFFKEKGLNFDDFELIEEIDLVEKVGGIMDKKYSCIVEFDEMNDTQIEELWKYLLDKNIKFHVLKANDDYLKEQKKTELMQEIKEGKELKKLSYQQIGSYLLEQGEKLAFTNEINKQIHYLGKKINEIVDEINKIKKEVVIK